MKQDKKTDIYEYREKKGKWQPRVQNKERQKEPKKAKHKMRRSGGKKLSLDNVNKKQFNDKN